MNHIPTGSRILAVVGATGAQGGGLARAALADPDRPYHVRALTRRPDGDRAAALAQAGAEVVHADLDDLDSLRRAFDGADAVYCVTNYWELFSPEREIAQATNLAEAARSAGVRHAIWSTFEDTRERVPLDDDRMPTLMGRYKVPHFDGKAEADRAFTERGVPTTFLLTSFYWDNFIHFGLEPRRGADGVLVLSFPLGDAKLPGIAAEDVGRCAYGIFQRGESSAGTYVGIAGEHLTGDEMARALGRALGEPVRYEAADPDAYRALGFPGADDMGNMFQYKRDFNDAYCAARSVDESRALNPDLLSFDAWLDRHARQIPRAAPATLA